VDGMKSMMWLLFSWLCIAETSSAQPTDVEDANVAVNITSEGGHTGRCAKVVIRNLSSGRQFLRLKAGALFKSYRPEVQDLLLAEHLDSIVIAPGGSFEKRVYGFCTQPTLKSPSSTQKFKLDGHKNEKLMELAEFLATNRLQDNPYAQQAVWAVANGHSIAGINYKDPRKSTQKLLRKVCQLLNMPFPWYYIEYAPADTTAAFSNRILKVRAKVDFNLAHNDVVTIVLLDKYKQTTKVFYKNKPFHQGNHSYTFTLNGTDITSDFYTLKVYSNSKLIKQKTMQL